MLEKQNKKVFEEIGDKLEKFMGANHSAALKGKTGEEWVAQLLHNDPTINVNYVAKDSGGHQGDLIVTFKNSDIKVMIDVKNWASKASKASNASKVSKIEREKFFSDLEANASFNAGVLLSLKGGFLDAVDEFKVYKTLAKRKPYMFLGNLITKRHPDIVLKLALFMLDLYAQDEKASTASEKSTFKLILAQIERWEESMKRATKATKNAENHLKFLQESENQTLNNLNFIKIEWEKIQRGKKDTETDEPMNKIRRLNDHSSGDGETN
jgi:hypothetical protein